MTLTIYDWIKGIRSEHKLQLFEWEFGFKYTQMYY